ncbi:MAG: protein kinase [bacterium]|nr:protein kinase [bacterium]
MVRVYDYREDPEQHLALISMEYVAGGTLEDLLDGARQRSQPVPVNLVLAILAQTLEALGKAHQLRVIHRDVTPGNVLLAGGSAAGLLAAPTRDPKVKLVDFGIAGLVDREELSHKTRALGTSAYMAPEVLDRSGRVTTAVDVYGAGALAYELLTGRLPLSRFPQPSALRGDVSKELEQLLLALLDLDPAKRPPASLARQWVGFLVAGRTVSQLRVQRGERTVAFSNSRRNWGAVTGLIAIGALIATLVFLQPWQWLRSSQSPVRVDPNVEASIEESADAQVIVPLVPTAEESANPAVEPPAEQREQAPADNDRAAGEQRRKPELSQGTKNPNGERTLAEDVGSPELERSAPAPFVVEITLTRDQPRAQQLASQLDAGGYEASISPVEISGNTRYRVRVGPFHKRSQAEVTRDRLNAQYRLDTWVTQVLANNDTTDGEQLRKPDLSQVTKNSNGEKTLPVDVGSTQSEGMTPAPRPVAGVESPASEGFVVAVFSTRDQARAQKLAGQLESGGYKAFMSPVEISGKAMYRVRVGPFRNRSQAEATRDRLNAQYRLDTWVTAAGN